MILVSDVYYYDNKAKSVLIGFDNWDNEAIVTTSSATLLDIAEYVPGEFYKRELPCILTVLKTFDLTKITHIIVDGYVILNDEGKLGLGGYLFNELDHKIPIIGVAKRNFADNVKHVRAITRGASQNPLYITSLGINVDVAAEKIKAMKGEYRIPTVLKMVDQLSREIR